MSGKSLNPALHRLKCWRVALDIVLLLKICRYEPSYNMVSGHHQDQPELLLLFLPRLVLRRFFLLRPLRFEDLPRLESSSDEWWPRFGVGVALEQSRVVLLIKVYFSTDVERCRLMSKQTLLRQED